MHPLVRSHEVAGEKSLYCDGSYAVGIEGMKPEESGPLLQFWQAISPSLLSLAAYVGKPACW